MVDKNLIICPEVKSNFGLAASDFQSMVTGESVSANRKHQETLTVRKWTSQMLLAGNDVPPWPDSLGAIFRRLFCVRLEHAVRDDQVDTTIARKLRVELPALLLKFHACYLQLLEDFAEVSFWSFADEKFRKAREGIEQELNPTKKFLYNADMLDRDNEDQRTHEQFSYYIPYARFMELCMDWEDRVLQRLGTLMDSDGQLTAEAEDLVAKNLRWSRGMTWKQQTAGFLVRLASDGFF